MKSKYTIDKDKENKHLIIKEYAELDKEMMSLLCEETYPIDTLKSAIKEGTQTVISTLRTNNMYPPTIFAQAIAEAVEGLLADGGNPSAELFFDDKELFNVEADQSPPTADNEVEMDSEEDVEVDDLLDETLEDDYEDDKVLKDIKSSIQVADDDSNEMDDIG